MVAVGRSADIVEDVFAAKRIWLRLGAVVVVLFLTAGLAYKITRTPHIYVQSATVVLYLPKSRDTPNEYLAFAPSLITTGNAMTQILMSPQAQRQIRAIGGTANVNIALVNLYDEEYPNYGVPLATLTTTSLSPAADRSTFVVAVGQLHRLLAARQANLRVRPRNRISAQIIGDTGPLVQAGSSKRVMAGLAALALVALSALWSFIDRRGEASSPARRSMGSAPDAGVSRRSLADTRR
jgi:hypothetical protein